MKKISSQPTLRSFLEENDDKDSTDDIAKQVAHLSIQKPEPCRKCEEFCCERHGLFRAHLQKANAARFEQQLRASWELEDMIEEQLNSFQGQHSKSMTPTRLKDVAQLLMPKGTPAPELAASTWLGGWRPSAILDLLRSLSSSLSDSKGVEQVLPQLLNETRIEEAIIDEEMAEIQANCILHLPFGPKKKEGSFNRPALDSIQSEFEKIHRVIIKAQNLRLKVLETVVKNVLGEADAAEFLSTFGRIQNFIHQVSTQTRLQKTSVPQSLKLLAPFEA